MTCEVTIIVDPEYDTMIIVDRKIVYEGSTCETGNIELIERLLYAVNEKVEITHIDIPRWQIITW